MKKIYMACLLTAAVVCAASAHAPSELKGSFNAETRVLNVTFSHAVSDANSHYITEIKIFLNGKQIIEQKLLSQENGEGGELVYRIPDAEPGDKLRINARCNKIGAKTLNITIE
ncbi:MAG TPA: hypothetical protein ENN03_07060 [bacterium]|nr:hypothetical protein [bacterium]